MSNTDSTPSVPETRLAKNNVRDILKYRLDPENPNHIPPAKVTQVIANGAEGINTIVKERLKPYKENHRKYVTLSREFATAAGLSAERKAEITKALEGLQNDKDMYDAINREKIRIGGDAMVALSMICEDVMRSLIHFACDTCLSQGGKQVEATHMHTDAANSLPIWRLIKRLPSWVQFPAEFLPKARARKGKLATTVLSAATSTVTTADTPATVAAVTTVATTTATTATTATTTPVAAENNSDDTADDVTRATETNEVVDEKKTNFSYYATEICRMLTSKVEKFGKLRVSHTLTKYCDRLLTEFLNLLARNFHACIYINEQKTLSDTLVYAVLQLLMLEDQRVIVDFTVTTELVADKNADVPSGTEPPKVEKLVAHKTLRTADGYYENLCEHVQRKVERFNQYFEDHPQGTLKEVPPPKPPRVKKTAEEKAAEKAAEKNAAMLLETVPDKTNDAAVKPKRTKKATDKEVTDKPATDKQTVTDKTVPAADTPAVDNTAAPAAPPTEVKPAKVKKAAAEKAPAETKQEVTPTAPKRSKSTEKLAAENQATEKHATPVVDKPATDKPAAKPPKAAAKPAEDKPVTDKPAKPVKDMKAA